MFVINVIGKGAAPSRFAKFDLGPAVILSEGYAFDLPVATKDAALLAQARGLAPEWDINLVPTQHRLKRLLAADMDSTIIAVECLDELAAIAGLGPQIAALTARAMRGEISWDQSFQQRVRMLKGMKLSALDRAYDERVRLDSGAKNLIATMRAHGAHTMLLSGGFTFFTRRVAEAAGFHTERGNTLLDDGEALTGELATPLQTGADKRQAMEEEAVKLGITRDETMAVGDGANDLEMIGAAGLGVAYHAKPVLAAAADAVIANNDLTALLYLQGYTDGEISRA